MKDSKSKIVKIIITIIKGIMKIILQTGLCVSALAFIFSGAVYAANGDVAGNIYSTDILAVVNGFPMESYNIGGKTAVIAEDLHELNYGFYCQYNDNDRVLYVCSGYVSKPSEEITASVIRGVPGEIAGNFYETDVKVVFNGQEVAGYNIGGRMAVCIEDLGTPDDSANAQYGYSKYLCNFTYNNDTRTVTLDSIKGDHLNLLLYEIKFRNIRYSLIADNIIELVYDPMMKDIEIDLDCTDSMSDEKYLIKPLYFSIDGNLTEVGVCYIQRFGCDDFNSFICMIDVDKANDVIASQLNTKILSYDEAIKLFYESGKYAVHDRRDNDRYTVLVVSGLVSDGQHEQTEDGGIIMDYEKFKIMAINKSGGYFAVDTAAEHQTVTMVLSDDDMLEYEIYPFTDAHGNQVTLSANADLNMYN